MFKYVNKTQDLILPTYLPKLMKNKLINDSNLYEFQQLLLNFLNIFYLQKKNI